MGDFPISLIATSGVARRCRALYFHYGEGARQRGAADRGKTNAAHTIKVGNLPRRVNVGFGNVRLEIRGQRTLRDDAPEFLTASSQVRRRLENRTSGVRCHLRLSSMHLASPT